jgi:ribosomal protein L24E
MTKDLASTTSMRRSKSRYLVPRRINPTVSRWTKLMWRSSLRTGHGSFIG